MFLSFLSIITFLSSITLGIWCIILDPKSKLNQAFLLISISAAIWSFGYIFVFKENDKETIWFWYRFASIGWLFIFFAGYDFFYFFLDLKNKFRRILLFIRNLYLILIFLPIIFQFTGTLFVVDFIKTPFGNAEVIDIHSPGYFIIIFLIIFSFFMVLAFIITGYKYNNSKRYRIQAIGLLISISLTFSLIIFFNVIFPLISKHPFPSIGVLFLNIYIIGFFYLINKYKLMRLDYSLLKDEVIDTMSDMIIIVSPEMNIIKANKVFCENFKIDEMDYPKTQIKKIFLDKKLLNKSLNKILLTKEKIKLKKITMKTDQGKEILVNITLFPVFDKLKDYSGTIIIAQIMDEYEQIMNQYKISQQEKIIIFHLMRGLLNKEIASEMNISSNTVKNYIANIYQKTNVANRVELINLFFSKEI